MFDDLPDTAAVRAAVLKLDAEYQSGKFADIAVVGEATKELGKIYARCIIRDVMLEQEAAESAAYKAKLRAEAVAVVRTFLSDPAARKDWPPKWVTSAAEGVLDWHDDEVTKTYKNYPAEGRTGLKTTWYVEKVYPYWDKMLALEDVNLPAGASTST